MSDEIVKVNYSVKEKNDSLFKDRLLKNKEEQDKEDVKLKEELGILKKELLPKLDKKYVKQVRITRISLILGIITASITIYHIINSFGKTTDTNMEILMVFMMMMPSLILFTEGLSIFHLNDGEYNYKYAKEFLNTPTNKIRKVRIKNIESNVKITISRIEKYTKQKRLIVILSFIVYILANLFILRIING